MLGWAVVWVVLEILVVASGSSPGRPIGWRDAVAILEVRHPWKPEGDPMERTARSILIVTGILLIASGLAHAILDPPALRLDAAATQVSAPPAERAQLPSVRLPAALARVLADYEAAWRSKDAAALAGLFAEDGFVLSNGAPPVRGRHAIRTHYEGQGGPLSLRAVAFATEGSLGYIIGGFARRAGEPDIGKFTLTLRRGEDGRWLIVSDMDNGNSRP